jgi:alkaline phosphatase
MSFGLRLRLRFALLASLALAGSALGNPRHCVNAPDRAQQAILMIADGVGFNAWLGSGYYHHGQARGFRYQQSLGEDVDQVLLGVATQALHEGSEPRDAGYSPRRRWASGLFQVDAAATTDSAAASTALHTGRKTLRRFIGLDAGGRPLDSLHRMAARRGLRTGVVSSVPVSHATPAAAWARQRDRDEFAAIIRQMSDGALDLMIGAGHPYFDDVGAPVESPSDAAFEVVGGRARFERLRSSRGLHGYAFVDSLAEFEALAAGEALPARVFGLAPVRQTLQQARPRGQAPNPAVPGLPLLAQAALRVLSSRAGGFVLTIEGGATDWANHANDLPRFVEEMGDFERSVDAVVEWVEQNSCWQDTLLIVTADHETGGLWPSGSWKDVDGDGRYTDAVDSLIGHRAPRPTARGVLPDLVYGTDKHSSELVPLWALGRGARVLAIGARHDRRAQSIWGPPLAWDGRYIDNTAVFHGIAEALGLAPTEGSRTP